MSGILVGALISGGFALFGVLLTARREHSTWLRNQRFEVCSRMLSTAHELIFERALQGARRDRWGDLSPVDALAESMVQVSLLGPRSVVRPAGELFSAAARLGEGGPVEPNDARLAPAILAYGHFRGAARTELTRFGRLRRRFRLWVIAPLTRFWRARRSHKRERPPPIRVDDGCRCGEAGPGEDGAGGAARSPASAPPEAAPS
jgi:hypothetical protein